MMLNDNKSRKGENCKKETSAINTITRGQFNRNIILASASLAITPIASAFESSNKKTENKMYDVIIIGGSYAGLAAAMTMGRSLRDTLVIDGGKPCNAQTPHSHNFITQDGETPAAISVKAKQQVLKYSTVSFEEDLVKEVSGENGNFKVSTLSEKHYKTKKLIFATGIKDLMPELKGFADCWGITAIHCPYCHGYEVKSKNTGILVNDESALDFAKLILNWTDEVTIYSNGEATFKVSELEEINVKVNEKLIQQIEHKNGYMSNLHFQDGTKVKIKALYHRAAYEQHCAIPKQLGCEMTETGHIKVTDFQQTNISGIYAVGDAASPMRAVSLANASGSKAGFILNHELIMENY